MAITLPRLYRPRKSVQWQRDAPASAPSPAPSTRERQPEGATLLVAGVGVPVLRALVTGVLAFPVIFAVLAWWGWAWRDVFGGAGFTAAAVTFGAWLLSYAPSWRMVEAWSGIDLNRDGQVGESPTVNYRVEVREPRQAGGGTIVWHRVTLPASITPDVIAASVLNGAFTEREWTGRGKPFSQEQFRQLRENLIAAGLLMWRDGNVPQMGVDVPPDAVARWEAIERGERK